MDYTRRRSSTGKSSYIDLAIGMINDIKLKSTEFQNFVKASLDKTLFSEIRSIAWRIFLDILPVDKQNKWVEISRENRNKYDSLCAKYENEFKLIDKVITKENCNEKNLVKVIDQIQSIAMNEAKTNNIFNSLSESSQKIYLVWYGENLNKLKETEIEVSFRILLSIMFALFPSIVNVSIENCDIDPEKETSSSAKEIFYFLNTEDYYDHDVYTVFTSIMNRGFFNVTSQGYSSKFPELSYDIVNLRGSNLTGAVTGLSRSDIGFIVYLNSLNHDLVKEAIENKVELTKTLYLLISTILSRAPYDMLIYFWDCLLACDNNVDFNFNQINKDQSSLHFVDFLACSILSHSSKEVVLKSPENIEKIICSIGEIDQKNIIIDALKLRELVISYFEE
jgi:hypothetical protein